MAGFGTILGTEVLPLWYAFSINGQVIHADHTDVVYTVDYGEANIECRLRNLYSDNCNLDQFPNIKYMQCTIKGVSDDYEIKDENGVGHLYLKFSIGTHEVYLGEKLVTINATATGTRQNIPRNRAWIHV